MGTVIQFPRKPTQDLIAYMVQYTIVSVIVFMVLTHVFWNIVSSFWERNDHA